MEAHKTVETTPTPKQVRHPDVGVHATLLNKGTFEVKTLQAATRTELAKMLEEYANWDVLSVVRGKRLTVKEKKRFNFV